VMTLRGTASGMLFAAHLPRQKVLAALADEQAAELRQQGRDVPAGLTAQIDAGFEAELAQIREHGVSRISGGAIAGVSAMAAPVFDEAGGIVLSLTAIGPTAVFDSRWDGEVATALRRGAHSLSKQLGAPARG